MVKSGVGHKTYQHTLEMRIGAKGGVYLLLNLILSSGSWAMIVANVNEIDQPIRIFANLSGAFHICASRRLGEHPRRQ